MSFKVTFTRKRSSRLAGTYMYTCIIKCTNMVFGETVDIALIPSDGSQPWYYRDTKFKAGQSYEFSFDAVDWTWCQDDVIAIVDKNNRIKEKWQFHMKEYLPGECPECHGTHKCKACHGQGFIMPRNLENLLRPGAGQQIGGECNVCGGTGTCVRCDIPYRTPRFGGGPTGLKPF